MTAPRYWQGNQRRRSALAVSLALLALLVVLATLPGVGVTWDEPLYIKASRGYMAWLGLLRRGLQAGELGGPLSDAKITAGWMPHPTLELHPPLGKLLSGLTFASLGTVLGETSAHRASTALLFSLLVAMVFWVVATEYGTVSGVFGALSLVLMPRMFFHAHLANIDIATATTWFLATFVYRRLEPRGGVWPVLLSAVAFGLALATKMNAVVLPLVWGLWVILFRRNRRSLARLLATVGGGSILFVLLWPWLYRDTANRLLYYVLMASRFKDRPQFYLGQTFPHVPWHYPFVITLAVVPTVIVVMSLLGCLEVGRRRPADPTGWLLILNALTPLLFAATGLQAAYSGERHFIPAYPYLACLAGVGFGTTFALLRTRLQVAKRRLPTVPLAAVVGLLLGLLFVPAMISAGQVFPYELSYYSEVVGGLPGATRLGLETTFWCETYVEALPFLNEHAEPGASIWAENPFVLRYYQRSGLLRLDLEATGGDTVSPLSADYALVQRRQTGFDYYTPDIGSVMASHEPVFSVERQGELLLELFRIVGRSTS